MLLANTKNLNVTAEEREKLKISEYPQVTKYIHSDPKIIENLNERVEHSKARDIHAIAVLQTTAEALKEQEIKYIQNQNSKEVENTDEQFPDERIPDEVD